MHSLLGHAMCSLGVFMLLACGQQRYAVRSPFEPDARAWAEVQGRAPQTSALGMDAQSASACAAIETSSCPDRAVRCAQAQALARSPNLGGGGG